jgi:EAL domain-containing protein (putative c-di-GMP-specific phosphodiesterase class I)
LVLAFNFPLDVLLRPEALSYLDTVRTEAGIAPGRVVVELTESSPLAGLTKLCEAIQRLRALGYGIAIDDVGPGLRDHRGLLGLGFTELKLDMALVRDALVDPGAQEFLAEAIEAATAAGLTVTAEGVEDEATWQRMRAIGVDRVQGYLISRPLPVAAVLPWHREWCASHAVPATL